MPHGMSKLRAQSNPPPYSLTDWQVRGSNVVSGLRLARHIALRRRVWVECDEVQRGYASVLAGGRSSRKKNRVPWPAAVSTRSSVPIARTSLRQIASPRPALENWCRVSDGTGRHGWYRLRRVTGSMPLPLSLTENSSSVEDWGCAAISTKPESVYLTAFVARFNSTRDNARACPTRRSGTGCTSRSSSCFAT